MRFILTVSITDISIADRIKEIQKKGVRLTQGQVVTEGIKALEEKIEREGVEFLRGEVVI